MVSQEAWLRNRRMQTELVLLLLLLSHLSGVLLTPVDLTNRTDVGGLVQDHHIDLDWLGTLLKGFGPVLVPQPTPESAIADDSQSDNRADADEGDDSQSESRADTDDGDDSQSESRVDTDVGGVPKEETLNRKRLSVDSDFLKALLSSDDEGTADQGGGSGPLNNGVKISLEEDSSAGATENYAAEIEGLVAPSLTVSYGSGGENLTQGRLQNSTTENVEGGATESSGGKIQESVTATPKQNEDAANANDEDNAGRNAEGNSANDNAAEDTESDNAIDESAEEVLGTDNPIIPSWYNSQEYDNDLYPYTGWEDPWESWGWPVLPTEAPDTTPEQIHISWGNASSQMVVMWSTKSHGTGRVQYGIAPGNYSQEVAAVYNNFWYGNNEGLQHIYRAVLTGLLPGRSYSYKVLCDEDVSPGFLFTAKRDDLDWSPELLVYGDMGRVGGAPSLARLKHEAETGKYAAVLHVGDFAYDLHTEGGKYGDDFMNRIQDIATKLPYMTCPGNHEIEFDFNPYLTRFSMPQSPWPGTMDKMWYSFNLGRAHFISYSSEVYFTDSPAEEQYKWLLQDLTEANSAENRTLHPWIIAFGHRPMYCSNVDGDDCTTAKSRVRAGLEDLFYQQGVDLIIEAHEHSYERLWPVYNSTLVGTHYRDPRAPVHIISGAAGCNEFDGVCVNPMMGPKGPWSAYRAWVPGLYGYGRLRVQNSTHVHWEQVLAVNGQVIDSAQVIQHRHGPFGEE
ncbi:acid phosphatase type 7-like isoform X1 [Branchiostoma floridae]|uniref:Purple acid phosphatase n=2 Tax=Branchiostoma floridae TaxID=7739 RepID=A0A9J7LB91_BRAFL|nr:acid phosphatase type 7-like isoform X1 [Branchiostoma floridae]